MDSTDFQTLWAGRTARRIRNDGLCLWKLACLRAQGKARV